MKPLLAFGIAVAVAACASASHSAATSTVAEAPAAVHTSVVYARIPQAIGAFKLTERAVVRAAPFDSIFRYSDSSPTILSVIIYAISNSSKVDADSQKWTAREGALFEKVEEIQRQRGVLSDYKVAFSDSERFNVGKRQLLEHSIAIPVRYANGRIAVESQHLYLIDGKFVKVRATVPLEGWEHNDALIFGRKLATILATDP
jgi:hypothetical protein